MKKWTYVAIEQMSKLKAVIKEIEELSGTKNCSGEQCKELCKQLEMVIKENLGGRAKWSIVSPKSSITKALNIMITYVSNVKDIINSVLINLTNVLNYFVFPGTDKEIRNLCLTLMYKTTVASISASVPFQFWSEIYMSAFQFPKDTKKIVKVGSFEKVTVNDLFENFNSLLDQINWKDTTQFSYWWNIIAASGIPIIYSYKDSLGEAKIQELSTKLLELIVKNLSIPSPIHVVWTNTKIEQRSLFGNPEDVRAFILIMLNYPTYDNSYIKENPIDTLLQDAFTFIFGCTTFCHNNDQNIDQPTSFAEFKLAASSSKSIYTLFTHFTFKVTERVISIIKLFKENYLGPLFFMKLFSQAYTLYQKLVLETSKFCTEDNQYRTMCHMNTCLAMLHQMIEEKTSSSDDEGLLSIIISNILDERTVNSCIQFLIQAACFGVSLSNLRHFQISKVSEYFFASYATFIACASFHITSRVPKERLRNMNSDLELMVQNPVYYAVEFLSIPLLDEYRCEYKQCLGFLQYFSFDGMDPCQVINFISSFLRYVDEKYEGTAIAAYSQAWVKLASLVRGTCYMQYIGDTLMPALINTSKQQHFKIHYIYTTIGFIVCQRDRFAGCPLEERDTLFSQLLSGVTIAKVNKKIDSQKSNGAFDVVSCAIRLIDLDNDYSFALMPFVANAIRKIDPTSTNDIKSLNLFIRAITDITVAGLTTDKITIPESFLELAKTPLLNRPSRESLLVGQSKSNEHFGRMRTLTAVINSNNETMTKSKSKSKIRESRAKPPKEVSGEILLQWASEFLESVECSHLLEAMDLEAAVMRLFIEVIAGTERDADDSVFTLLPTRIPFASQLLFKMLQILPQFYPELIKRAPMTLQKFASSLTQVIEVTSTEPTIKYAMEFASDILLVTDDEILRSNCLSVLSTDFSQKSLTEIRNASIDSYITTKYVVPGNATLEGGVEIVSNNQKHSMVIKNQNGALLALVQNEQGSNLYHLEADGPIKEVPIPENSIFGWQPPAPLLINSVMLAGKNVRKNAMNSGLFTKPLQTSLVFLGRGQSVRDAFLNPWQKVTKGFKSFVEGLGTPKNDKKVHWRDNRKIFEAAIVPLFPESERSMVVTSQSSVIIYNGHDSNVDLSEPFWNGLKFVVVVSPAHEGLLRVRTRYYNEDTPTSLDPTSPATEAYGPIRETAIVSKVAICALIRCTMFTAMEL